MCGVFVCVFGKNSVLFHCFVFRCCLCCSPLLFVPYAEEISLIELTIIFFFVLFYQILPMFACTRVYASATGDGRWCGKDMYNELKDGVVLCNLMNTLFPGAIKRVHKSSFAAHQVPRRARRRTFS